MRFGLFARRAFSAFRSLCCGLVFVLGGVRAASAAALTADLGDGLGYHRAHDLPQDLPPEAPQIRGLILDLRYVEADEPAATALQGWLRFRVMAARPVLVLVNGETSPALRTVLAASRAQPGLLTIGAAQSGYSPDLVIDTTAEAEKRAYNALELGAAISAVLSENVAKPRTDEASITREHSDTPDPADQPEGEIEFDDDANASVTMPDKPPPLDLTLQRAVHVYRALRALKRV